MTASQTWQITKRSFNEWNEDKAMRLAAALACYTIISLAPLVVISLKVSTMVLGPDGAKTFVRAQMTQLIGPQGATAIGDMMENAAQPGAGTLAAIISFLVLLFSASGVFAELQDSMNTVWEIKPRPDLSWWDTIKKRFFSMAMVFGIIFLLLVSMFITAALGTIVTSATGTADTDTGLFAKAISYGFDLVFSTAVVALLFALIFKYLPDVNVKWRDVWLGALVTAVLFKLGQYALAVYFKFGSTTSAYGAAGSLVAVLLWAYYSACILFFGAEFTQAYTHQMGERITPDEDAVPVTDEERAQQGMPRERDLQESYEQKQLFAGHRGALPRQEPAVPRRRVVTITRPARRAGKSAAIAGVGIAAGFAVALLGMMKGRRLVREGVDEAHLRQRLDRVEAKIRKVTGFALTTGNGNGNGNGHATARSHRSEAWETLKQGARNAIDNVREHARHG